MKIQYLSKKDAKKLIENLEHLEYLDRKFIEYLHDNRDDVKVYSFDKYDIFVFGPMPALFKLHREGFDRYLIPTLYAVNVFWYRHKSGIIPLVVVDEGAVKPIVNGADIMAPGIRKFLREFDKEWYVGVLEPNEKYVIAVGLSLMSSKEIQLIRKGKAIKNLNRLNDDLWNQCLEIARKHGLS